MMMNVTSRWRESWPVQPCSVDSARVRVARTPKEEPRKEASSAPKTRTPSAPTWIHVRMMTCPKRVKPSPVGRTTRPVCETADVMVKQASSQEIG